MTFNQQVPSGRLALFCIFDVLQAKSPIGTIHMVADGFSRWYETNKIMKKSHRDGLHGSRRFQPLVRNKQNNEKVPSGRIAW
jgi:hypothetical protein